MYSERHGTNGEYQKNQQETNDIYSVTRLALFEQ